MLAPIQERDQREAKCKLVAQPEISHEAAEAMQRSQAARTDEKFPGIIHVSHQLALSHGHENVFFCTQCGAVNAGGSLRLLKSLCDGSGESRQKGRRKLERGLMPHETCCGRCGSAHFKCARFSLTLLDALNHRALSISLVIKKKRICRATPTDKSETNTGKHSGLRRAKCLQEHSQPAGGVEPSSCTPSPIGSRCPMVPVSSHCSPLIWRRGGLTRLARGVPIQTCWRMSTSSCTPRRIKEGHTRYQTS